MAKKLPAILDDKEGLAEMYKTRTIKQIADKIGCSATTVNRALRRHGIRRRPAHRMHHPDLDDPEALAKLYETNSLQQMADILGCSKATVNNRMKKFNIKTRLPSLHLNRNKRERSKVNPRRVPADEWGLIWTPKDDRDLITNCWWRLHVLSGMCPLNCPDAGFCDQDRPEIPQDDGRKGCPMYNRLRNRGEFNPRPWEQDNPFVQWGERLADAPNQSVTDDLDIPYY